jgi:hypothetical protein
MDGLTTSRIDALRNTTKKVYLKDAPISVNGVTASTTVIPQAQEAAEWGKIAQAAAVIAAPALMTTELTPAIDVDTPDNSDLTRSEAPRVQVNEQGETMMYDPKTGTYFPVTIVLPGNNTPAAPAAPTVDEKEKRKQLIMIFAGMLILLLIILFMLNRKK